jgi:hypothetical protein
MRALPSGLAAQLASGAVASLATCFVLIRKDGVSLGFTDHDQPIALNGVTCAPGTGFTPGAAELELGPRPDALAVQGVLDAAGLTEADIAAGLYDGAEVSAWRVDWTQASLNLLLWRGLISRLIREGAAYTAEIEGPLRALQITAGRTYQRSCDAALGDVRCGVDVSGAPYLGKTCDKDWRTCRDSFHNLMNFQGFPDIPGGDYLTMVASDSPLNTGGSQRS